jgi:iron complex outermembrane recepter protein
MHFRPTALIAAAATVLGLAASMTHAGPAERTYQIAAQPLSSALKEFAAQSDLQLIFSESDVAQVQSVEVSGSLAPQDALAKMLRDAELQFEFTANNVVVIRKPPRRAPKRTTARPSPRELPDASAEDRVEEVLVTGTNIHDVAPAGSPVIVLDSGYIRDSGYSSTQQLLQALPQNFRGGQAGASADVNLSTGAQKRLNATAGSGVNLRGLGSTATLVLVNGRRIAASSAGTFPDVSMIPINAIERIEILADGASAIYGADAVAGVVNIILKKRYEGAESRVNYGFTTESGLEEYRLSQNFGMGWSSGGMLLALDHLDQSQLSSSERDFTSNVRAPTSIFPANELSSALFSGHQALGDAWSLQAEGQYSRSDRHLISSSGANISESFVEPVRTNAGMNLEYRPFADWRFSLDSFVSKEDTKSRLLSVNRNTGAQLLNDVQTQTQDQWAAELRGAGGLFRIPGGVVKAAATASYREEEYMRHRRRNNRTQDADRDVTSLSLEFHAPIVSDLNAFPGVQSLEFSIAGRYDDYSDFGSTNNPKAGVSWSPLPGLTLRSSYSTSFRAPSMGEELRASDVGVPFIDIWPFFTPDGSDFTPVVLLFGSEKLGPEESENWSFGFNWEPAFAPGLSFGFTYYDISYTDRIILPPFDFGALGNPELQTFVHYFGSPSEAIALVDDLVQQGAFLSDFTDGMFGPDPLSQTTAAYRYMWTNAESVDVSGFDLVVEYLFSWRASQFRLGLNANYIEEMLNVVARGATPFDLVDTFANPPDLRVRGSLSWTYGGFSGAVNVNYTDSYTDTSGAVDRPVNSFTTVDGAARYAFSAESALRGFTIALIATNIFDEAPPYVGFGGERANYDAANASPLGRMLAMEISKRW